MLAITSAALEKRARFYFFTVVHELGGDWLHVHEQLLGLVSRREHDAAEIVARRHIEDTGAAVRELLFPGA